MSAEQAVRLVSSGDRVFVHGGSAVPGLLLSALLGRSPELHDVELVHLHLNGPVAMASAAAAPNILSWSTPAATGKLGPERSGDGDD
jgi:hypothetical protein